MIVAQALVEGARLLTADGALDKYDVQPEIRKVGVPINTLDDFEVKSALVRSQAERLARINRGEIVVVGRNRWSEGRPSPLVVGADGGLFEFDPAAAAETLEMLRASKRRRRQGEVDAALRRLRGAARTAENLMSASIACARAGHDGRVGGRPARGARVLSRCACNRTARAPDSVRWSPRNPAGARSNKLEPASGALACAS